MSAEAWVAIVGLLLGVIAKLNRDIGKLQGEMGAMSRLLEADRRETHRVVGRTGEKSKSFVRQFLNR